MSILGTLSEKPWLGDSAANVGVYDENIASPTQAKLVALKIFLAVVSVLFSLFIVTFLARSQYPDFVALAGDVWQPFYDPIRLWLNTLLLILGSIFLQATKFALRKQRYQLILLTLGLALLFTVQFIIAQVMLWQHLYGLGYYVSSNPANSYFYVFTAIHGLHLVGGLFVLTQASLIFLRQRSIPKLSDSISLCALYWHYLLVVWLILFALMVSSPDTYATLAALCGYS